MAAGEFYRTEITLDSYAELVGVSAKAIRRERAEIARQIRKVRARLNKQKRLAERRKNRKKKR